ncbi:translation initiation factor IF-2-like [Alexandromys fortis]|uniref:translation initiation factor IF-2-like n=1 Tax=Alexandromys fortis TaxID=100897 RepID=UPI0021530971|nr:translation initiation factor IF-2-like [Microtus fortis]
MQDIFQPRANSKLRPVTNSNTSRSPSVGGSEASGHPQKLVALRRCQGRRAPRPSAQATGGTAPSPEPRGPRSARSPACAGRPFPEAAARPRHPRPARPPPATPPARAPPAPRPEVASPHGGQSGEGARSPPAARAHGRSAAARPRRPAAAARFWGASCAARVPASCVRLSGPARAPATGARCVARAVPSGPEVARWDLRVRCTCTDL